MSSKRERKTRKVRIETLPQDDEELTPEQQDRVEGGLLQSTSSAEGLSITPLNEKPINNRSIPCAW